MRTLSFGKKAPHPDVQVRYALAMLGGKLVSEDAVEDIGEPEYCCELMWTYIEMRNGRVDACETPEEFEQLAQDEEHAELCRKIEHHRCNPEAWALYAKAVAVGNKQLAAYAENELMQMRGDK